MRYTSNSGLDEDEVLRVPPAPAQTPAQRQEAARQQLINDMLRNHPGMTREEAQELLDYFG